MQFLSRRSGLAVLAALALATSAHAALTSTYTKGPAVFPGAANPSINALAVNHNPGSPYCGYVYVLDRISHHVMIFRPDPAAAATAATSYVDTGTVINVPAVAANGSSPATTPGSFSPFCGSVGSDDTVWLGDATQNKIFSAPPAPTGGATSVDATPQIDLYHNYSSTASPFVRGITAIGPISNAKVYLTEGNGPNLVQLWTGNAANASTVGTFTRTWQTDIGAAPTSITNGPYGPAVDPGGNVYVANNTGAASVFVKLDPTGAVVPFTAAPPANAPKASYLGEAVFVADPSLPGGGFLYLSDNCVLSGTSVSNKTLVLRYDLNGNYLDGFGPTVTPAPTNYSVVDLDIPSAGVPYADVDPIGNLYIRYKNITTGNSGVNKVFRNAVAVASAAGTTTGDVVRSSATAVDGIAYFGSNDGKLYAVSTADGAPDPNFNSGSPLDVSAALGVAVKIQSRPAVYLIHTDTTPVKNIYFTTDRGDVVKVKADGSGLVAYSAAATGAGNVATPAVTPDGTVYDALNSASGLQVVKLDENLANAVTSSVLGPTTGSITSPAVAGGNIYVGLVGSTVGDIAVLDSNLVPHSAGVAQGEGVTAPPFVSGIAMYTGTLAGRFYKVNSTTLAPDPTFGALNTPSTPGYAAIGEPLPNSPFPSSAVVPTGAFYTGSSMGKVWAINATDGSFNTLFDTGDATAQVGGLVVTPSNTVAFGTSAGTTTLTGSFYQVPLAHPTSPLVYGGLGAINTTPTLDRASKRFFVGSDDKNVYAPTDLF